MTTALLERTKRSSGFVAGLTRREFITGGGSLALLVACGRSSGPASERPETADGFPVTIEHKYGGTRILEPPRRVVTVGLSDHDPVLALGVKPVGVTDWYGDYPFATWPWAKDELGDARPEVMPRNEDKINFEKVLALNPDLIIGLYSGMTEQEYATASQIAATVAPSGEYKDWGMPWQEQTRMVGQALGASQRAEALISEIDARFAEAREQHPEFNGATAILVEDFVGGFSVRGPHEPRTRFLTSLGFQFPAAIAELVPEGGDIAQLSEEQLELIDTDVLIRTTYFEGQEKNLENNPLYHQLDAVREGREVHLDGKGPVAGALTWSTVLSLPFALDQLVPRLAAAVDGDPATTAMPG